MNVVLVHGAFADGSTWAHVIPALQDAGHYVVAAQLPLSSLSDDVATVRRALAGVDGPTVLVGHSYGGAVIGNAAGGALHVAGLVYLSAFIPDRGESLNDIIATFSTPLAAAAYFEIDTAGYARIAQSHFREMFAADVAEVDARALAAMQKPLRATVFDEKTASAAWHDLPSWALISENDRMIEPATQRRMAQRARSDVISVPSSHLSPVAHPFETTQAILEATRLLVTA